MHLTFSLLVSSDLMMMMICCIPLPDEVMKGKYSVMIMMLLYLLMSMTALLIMIMVISIVVPDNYNGKVIMWCVKCNDILLKFLF
jgi:hypothetical protein